MNEFMILEHTGSGGMKMKYCGYNPQTGKRTVMRASIEEAKELLRDGHYNDVATTYCKDKRPDLWKVIQSGPLPEPEPFVAGDELPHPAMLKLRFDDTTLRVDYTVAGEVVLRIDNYNDSTHETLILEAQEVKDLAVFLQYAAALGEQEKANG